MKAIQKLWPLLKIFVDKQTDRAVTIYPYKGA